MFYISPVFASGIVSVPPNLAIGKGYNSLGGLHLSGNSKAQCVKSSNLAPIGNIYGSEIKAQLHFISNIEELRKKFDSSQSANIGVVFKGISASAEGGIKLESDNYDKFKSTLAFVKISKTYPPLNLTHYELADGILELMNSSNNPNQFFKTCGDRFISGITVGSEVYALISSKNEDFQNKSKLDKFIKGKVGYLDYGAGGSLQSVLENINQLSKSSIDIQVLARGGKGNPISTDINHFLNTAVEYITKAESNDGAIMNISTDTYDNIIDSVFHSSVLNNIDLKLSKQRQYIEKLKSNINFLYEQSAFLDDSSPTHKNDLNKIQVKIDTNKSNIERCASNPFDPKACTPFWNNDSISASGKKLFGIVNRR